MKANLSELYDSITNDWLLKCKGKGCVRIATPMSTHNYVVSVLKRIITRMPEAKIFICLDSLQDRSIILDKCKSQDINTKTVMCITADYAKTLNRPLEGFVLGIMINTDAYEIARELVKPIKWGMMIIDRASPTAIVTQVDAEYPPVNNVANSALLNALRANVPTDEYRVGVVLSNDDFIMYNKYTEQINTSLSIFGDFSTIIKCLTGDKERGISAVEVRTALAHENGWNEYMEKTEFNAEIDKYYNPNALEEYASHINELLKKRRVLCNSSKNKLEIIEKIVRENEGKKIIIISLYGEYAAEVTKYLNDKFGYEICGDYHDCIEARPLVDDNGNQVYYKSGVNKGKPRYAKSTALSTMNLKRFNKVQGQLQFGESSERAMNCLSIRAASDADLEAKADLLIITGQGCGLPRNLLYRFNKIALSTPRNIYRLYMFNTIEELELIREKNGENVNVVYVDNNKEDDIAFE